MVMLPDYLRNQSWNPFDLFGDWEGKGAGNIYVDLVSEPKNALILPQGRFFYLASKDHSRNFLLQVKEFIFRN